MHKKIEDFHIKMELPFTTQTYTIIYIWHSNAPRLFHNHIFSVKGKRRDFGHVSLEIYECLAEAPEKLQNVSYDNTYISLWKGDNISLDNPFEFTSFDEDLQTLGRRPDVTVRLDRLLVDNIKAKFNEFYYNIKLEPTHYEHSTLNLWGLLPAYSTILACAAYLNLIEPPTKKYSCSSFIKELLDAGDIGHYFRYLDIPYSECFFRGIDRGLGSIKTGGIAGLLGISTTSFYNYLRPVTASSLQIDPTDDLEWDERGASATETSTGFLLSMATFLYAYLAQIFSLKVFSIKEINIEQHKSFPSVSSAFFLGSARGFVIGFVCGCLGINTTWSHSPSSIADLVLSAQKREEILRLSEGNTFSEKISSHFLSIIHYR